MHGQNGLSVHEGYEGARTEKTAGKWKAWAAWTISEGSHIAHHSTFLREDPKIVNICLSAFSKISFWEAAVSSSVS